MISYEKVRQSLKTLNIVIIVLNSLLTIVSAFGLVSLLLIVNNKEVMDQLGSEQGAVMQEAVTPFSLFISAVGLALMVAIIVLTIMNQSKIKKALEVSYMPYYLGFALSLLNIISTLLTTPSVLGAVIQLLFLSLYFFAYQKARTLNHKDQDLEQEDDQTIE
ncbi:hypothetical protein AT575_00705 [Streptococcus penaeicida]|uniref:DUF2127 domain-containing protein n=1 Tax=Streptococcus penaeicida TaxID=1765960 RepID=A0A2N8LDW1_9STRE|nr:hypothetical protein [Streptococcus penaeicida]PND48355.1 hypothetical protein AT575_00705 [Streptococcus penaeicida]